MVLVLNMCEVDEDDCFSEVLAVWMVMCRTVSQVSDVGS